MKARHIISGCLRWLIPALILVAAAAAHSQSGSDQALDDTTKKKIVETVLEAFETHYVYPDLAEKMSAHVRDRWKRGEYWSIATLDELTRQLKRDLREVSDDRHIWVEVLKPDELEPAIGEKAPAELIAERARTNFGFTRLERLAGNVGYLKLDRFNDAAWAGETAVAAMNFLANSDAVIIDLRHNHGGYDTMVRLISGYFYAEPTLLGTLYFAETDSVEQAWTGYVPGKSLSDKDLYILTSGSTASGAEAFSYSMKHYGRATIIGEKTRGAANWSEDYDFPDIHVRTSIPIARPVNPVTGTSWERTGVIPHVEASPSRALPVAHLEALSQLAKNCTDEKLRKDLQWDMVAVGARANPVVLTEKNMVEYTGLYQDGEFGIHVKDGVLQWRDGDGDDYALVPLSRDLFGFDDTDDYRIAIVRDSRKQVSGYHFLTRDGRPHPVRTRSGDVE
jgi:hypothetical protein